MRAQAGCFHRGFDRPVAGHDDHRARQAAGGPFLEQRNAVDVRHPDVEQDEIRLVTGKNRPCRGAVLSDGNAVTLVFQDFGNQFPYVGLVVDDEDM